MNQRLSVGDSQQLSAPFPYLMSFGHEANLQDDGSSFPRSVGDAHESTPGPLGSIYGAFHSILKWGYPGTLKIIQIRPLMTIVVLKLKPMVTWGSPI